MRPDWVLIYRWRWISKITARNVQRSVRLSYVFKANISGWSKTKYILQVIFSGADVGGRGSAWVKAREMCFFFRSGEIASCQSSREISHRWTNQTYSVMNPSGARSVVLVPNNPKVTAVFIRWSVICGRRWPAYYNYISLSLVRKLSKRNKITDPSRMGK